MESFKMASDHKYNKIQATKNLVVIWGVTSQTRAQNLPSSFPV